jgi:SPP1 family phage portal protein
MASFQQDFDISKIKELISDWETTPMRQLGIDASLYYLGENTTISAMEKKFWSDKADGVVNNPYVANYKIGYSKYHDIVAQKVNTLLDEAPTITNLNDDEFTKKIGFALKQAAIKASNHGRAFIYLGVNDNIKVFDTENCIPFYDDQDGSKIMAFIRYWDSFSLTKTDKIRFAEIYEQDGMTLMKSINENAYKVVNAKQAYRIKVRKDGLETVEEPNNPSKIPIVELDNNDEKMSDFTSNIRSKIDQIDILNSGFANNISDFSEIYWVVKNGAGMTSDEFEDFVASINKTKKVLLSGEPGALDVDMKQGQIPTAARQALIAELKAELIEDSGVIDTQAMTATALTTTAIKAATMKLRQRVSDFEWPVYNACEELINLYKEYHNLDFDFDIDFTELLINNDTEIIDNAMKIKDSISQRSYLELIKRANYIQNVDDEIEQLDEDSRNKFTLEEDTSDGGQGTSTDGQDDSGTGTPA